MTVWTTTVVSRLVCTAAAALLAFGGPATAQPGIFSGKPGAVVDLTTPEGVRLMHGQWRYRDASIVRTRFTAPGADGQPGSSPVDTYDYQPRAGRPDFDDSSWEQLKPDTLSKPRGHGHLSFNWYRIRLTIPERIGEFDPAGSTAVFETRVDDYAEIWVDGELPHATGQSGGSVVGGWNAVNRLVISRNVRPGQKIQLAIFGINGPISKSPTNYIFLHHARVEFHHDRGGPRHVVPHEVNVDVERLDPEIDSIVPLNPKLWKLAEGFQFTEGPVWDGANRRLLFSDPNANTIYSYSHESGLSVFRSQSGYAGPDIAEYGQPGSNGLTLDREGRLLIDEHGNHRVSRLERDNSVTVLADNYDGKRLNSPNDLVARSDGSVYFTDPPFGLPRFHEDPRRQLAYSGIYRWKDGTVTLLANDLSGPNGIAFSPDESHLYVGNWDDKRKIVMRYPVRSDGSLGAGEVFFDMTEAAGDDAIDGIKVDVRGNLYVSGPGGLWILSPRGKHLGTIRPPRHPHNFAWGDDGRTLYLTAGSALYRMPLKVQGIRP